MELIQKQKDDVSLEELAKQFSTQSKKTATLALDTVFGQKVFHLSDVKSIVIDDGDGKIKDITKEIIGGNK